MPRNHRFSIALDVDDVLLPCIPLACEKANRELGLGISPEDITGWIKPGTRESAILEYFRDPGFFRAQEPLEGSQEFVRKLSKKGEIFITTAVAPEVMGVRVSQIREFYPEIPEENIIPVSRKDVVDVDFMLDDGSHNVLKSNARYPVLMRRPWNSCMTGILAVSSYDEFLGLMDCIMGTYLEKEISFDEPTVIALVGPSGSGKTTIANGLAKSPKFGLPVSATTRKRRKGEPENAYDFVTEEEFGKMLESGDLAESTVYAGNRYGLETSSIQRILDSRRHCVIPADISGAFALKTKFRTVILYVKRDKEKLIGSLLERLEKKTSRKEDIIRRILSLDDEKRNEDLCDYIIGNNGRIEETVEEIISLTRN